MVPLNTWTHLVITGDDDQITLFVNGEENSSIEASLELGMDQIGETKRGEAMGTIDDFAIWKNGVPHIRLSVVKEMLGLD